MSKYNPKAIESKWREKWRESGLYKAEENNDKPKKYILDMFPYPSGAGLHVGHPRSYTATDIWARYWRMKGFNVLHPMGWDAFGLPAENYAIKAGVHPAESTKANIANFRRQIESLGLSYDWSREINTSEPEYYKWTQWLFLFLYQRGLAYRKKAKVNWCESCQTVLANEQVESGRCERCKNEVNQKELPQWFFKITDYAEELLADLDKLDWPEPIKEMQRNWIGRSEGAEIDFEIKDSEEKIKIFTTRPDTLFGATYMVVAPEHEILEKLGDKIENKTEVDDYLKQATRKNDLERTDLNKDKTGVEVKGVKVVNPANGEEVSVWVADYVLASYGTGAIMAVPAHDERDFEFARKYGLEIREVIAGGDIKQEAYTGEGKLINSGEFDGLESGEAKDKITTQVKGKKKVQYKLRDWLVSRQRYWGAPIPMVYNPAGELEVIKEEYLPLVLPEDVDYKPKGTSPLGSSEEYKKKAEELYGEGWYFEIDTMDTFVCSSWYYLRYTDPKNEQELAGRDKIDKWLPVDMYIGGAEHAVLHLLYARFITKALADGGVVGFREPFTALRNQGLILAEDGRKMSKSLGNVVNPDEMVDKFGADAMRMYEMFMGPFAEAIPWNTDGMVGVYRFLERVWEVADSGIKDKAEEKVEMIINQTIKKIENDIREQKFNTAVSQMMIAINAIKGNGGVTKDLWIKFLLVVAPFAPHIAEELWEKLGNKESIFKAEWPEYDENKIKDKEIEMVIQINGKVRDSMRVGFDIEESQAKEMALGREKIKSNLEGREVKRIIFVEGKLINLVV